MFNDRDLGVLGVGALLAVFCLLLPLPFVGSVVLGLLVLAGFILLALLRLGPDRVPVEVWLWRRIRFRFQARRYTYQQSGQAAEKTRRKEKTKQPEPQTAGRALPVLALAEVGFYPVVTVLLAVVGIYFLAWLYQGGAAEISKLIDEVLL